MTKNEEPLGNRIARAIYFFEARLDKRGRLLAYQLPSGDGGGSFEIAGINEKYHPSELRELQELLRQGRYQDAEDMAIAYIAEYTKIAAMWTNVPALEAYLRDCVFNRGAGGAARILQMALGDVQVDGIVGPLTKESLSHREPEVMLVSLRSARERYERNVVGRDERSKFWKGLVHRWDAAYTMATTYFDRGRL